MQNTPKQSTRLITDELGPPSTPQNQSKRVATIPEQLREKMAIIASSRNSEEFRK